MPRAFNPQVDDQNWKILFETHFQQLQSLGAISTMWISGFSRLGIDNSRRPMAGELTSVIVAYTGFELVQTDQNIILEQIDWYQMIADRKMPMTSFVRTPEELDYCDEPDIWHDIMGHVPFLAMPSYADMYVQLAETYITAYKQDRQDLLRALDFIGGMLIELGLVRESSGIKALGSTFYSSSEVAEAYKSENQIEFTYEALQSGESYDRHSFQGKYYILDSFEQLVEVVNSISVQL